MSKIKKQRIVIGICIGIILISVIGFGISYKFFEKKIYKEITIEVGSEYSVADFLVDKNRKATLVEKEKINLLELGEYQVDVKVGVFVYKCTLNIKDTIAPSAETVVVYTEKGQEKSPEEFVENIKDVTEVKVEYVEQPDFDMFGKQEVLICLTDTSGNKTELKTELIVRYIVFEKTFEAGTGVPDIRAFLIDSQQEDISAVFVTDMGTINMNQVGDYDIEIEADGMTCDVKMHIKDTTAPVLTMKNVTTYITDIVKAEDFVETVQDVTAVSYDFVAEPDVSQPGEVMVTVKATDVSGNSTEGTSNLTILLDQTPPVFSGIETVTMFTGDVVNYRNGVHAVDNRDGEVEFTVDSSQVNTSVAGTYRVIYTAVDSFGNIATQENTVTVIYIPQSAYLNVNCILQKPQLPTGCEVTSLAIALNYMGVAADKCDLADNYLDKTNNPADTPYVAFLGNPRDDSSYGCYAPVIVNCANRYLEEQGSSLRAKDYTGTAFENLYYELEAGYPVIVWATDAMAQPVYITGNLNGKSFTWYSKEHCLVLTGFDRASSVVYVADPLCGNVSYDLEIFQNRFKKMHSQAVIIK